MKIEDNGDDLFRWESVKQSLFLVMAIFLSTIFAVAFSKGVQKAVLIVNHSVLW